MTLLTSQKNDIYHAIEGAGLNPREFRWEMRDAERIGFEGSEAETLVHVPTGFFCMIENAPVGRAGNTRAYESSGDYLLAYEPGEESRVQAVTGISQYHALERIRTWVANIKRETSEPDLWAQLASEGEAFSDALASLDTDNTPFRPDEVRRISDSLDEVRAQLTAQHDVTEEQLRRIDKAIAALKAAAERVGRKDWMLMLGGTLVGLVGNAALPPETVKGLFQIVGHVFQWLLQYGRLLPPIS